METGRQRGLRWTALRRDVLTWLWWEGAPAGPYGLAEVLPGAFPNSLYRVLRSLEAAALVIPVAGGKRYLISPDPDCTTWGALSCADCDFLRLIPMPDEARHMSDFAAAHRFRANALVLECAGRCETCSRSAQ